MEHSVAIEKARSEHVRDIQGVYYRTWIDTYVNAEHGISREDIEDHFKGFLSEGTLRERTRTIETLPAERCFFVALADGKVVGVLQARKDEDRNRLRSLYVLPEYQGRGIGSLLWDAFEKFHDPSKDVEVKVAEFNDRAVAFYGKRGLVDTGERSEGRFHFKSGAVLTEATMLRAA